MYNRINLILRKVCVYVENNTIDERIPLYTITKRLLEIIYTVKNINIDDMNASLFSIKYYISPEDFIYILLLASKELNFKINDNFIDSLGIYSINDIAQSIMDNQLTQIQAKIIYQ